MHVIVKAGSSNELRTWSEVALIWRDAAQSSSRGSFTDLSPDHSAIIPGTLLNSSGIQLKWVVYCVFHLHPGANPARVNCTVTVHIFMKKRKTHLFTRHPEAYTLKYILLKPDSIYLSLATYFTVLFFFFFLTWSGHRILGLISK